MNLIQVTLLLLLWIVPSMSPAVCHAGQAAAALVDPRPGSVEVDPRCCVVFAVSSLGSAHAETLAHVRAGTYRVLVQESDPSGHTAFICIEPGFGSTYDRASGSLRVAIPNQKPFCRYLVLVSTPMDASYYERPADALRRPDLRAHPLSTVFTTGAPACVPERMLADLACAWA